MKNLIIYKDKTSVNIVRTDRTLTLLILFKITSLINLVHLKYKIISLKISTSIQNLLHIWKVLEKSSEQHNQY